MQKPSILCFGEVLWDLLPSGKIAGGAPMNVAFHFNQLGGAASMVSRIGDDDLGRELIRFFSKKGISTHFTQTDPTQPTGVVNVFLDKKGSPTYEIAAPSAWDFIAPDEALHDAATEADALVFGSLACRSSRSKKTLFELLDSATLRVFDVNLRPPFFSQTLLNELFEKADIVKMNDDELHLVASWHGQNGTTEAEKMHFLKEKHRLDALIVTRGASGAAILDESGLWDFSGFSVNVQDTIGSGDAFLAAFLLKMLEGADSPACLRFACLIGALTASKLGGTPEILTSEIHEFQSAKPAFYV